MINNIIANIIGGGGNSTSIIQNPLGSGNKINLDEATALASDILIGKLAFTKDGLTTGTLPKGMKYAKGYMNNILHINNVKNPPSGNVYIPTNLSFTPSYIFVVIDGHYAKSSTSSTWTGAATNNCLISNVVENTTIGRATANDTNYLRYSITNISAAGFYIYYSSSNYVTTYHDVYTNNYQAYWHAFGY